MQHDSSLVRPSDFPAHPRYHRRCGVSEPESEPFQPLDMNTDQTVLPPEGKSFAILAGGCFWCTEAIYAEMQGVDKVESGYTGGHIKNPGYREICTGRTGHAEAVRITFDPSVVTFGELLEVFWRTHDPTTLNRQGADVGTQYRSAIFPLDEEQERVARASLSAAEEAGLWDDSIVIVTSIEDRWPQEVLCGGGLPSVSEDYFANNPDQGYCRGGGRAQGQGSSRRCLLTSSWKSTD